MDRNQLVTDLRNKINKQYYDTVNYNMFTNRCWNVTSNLTEALGNILIGLSAILAFATGFFDIMLLSFISGCLATIAMVLLKFSSYSKNESSERLAKINKILEELGIEDIVDVNQVQNNEPDQIEI